MQRVCGSKVVCYKAERHQTVDPPWGCTMSRCAAAGGANIKYSITQQTLHRDVPCSRGCR